MIAVAAILNIGAAVGLCLLAAKYGFGPVPTDYHGAILARSGQDGSDASAEVVLVLRAVYRALAGALFGLALAIVLVTGFGVVQDALWAKVTVLLMALAAGTPSTIAAYRVEQATGVRSPWRPAAGLTAIVAVAFVVSLI